MADEKLEIEHIATDTGVIKLIEKQTKFLDRLEKKFDELGKTSTKSAQAAAGSFNAVEKELKEAEAALKGMAVGSKAFDAQRQKVDKLRESLNKSKQAINGHTGALSGMASSAVGKLVNVAAGLASVQVVITALNEELDKVKRLRAEAAGTKRTFEQALADVAQNVGAEAVPEARQMIITESPKLGVTQEGLANILGVAISAGAKDLKEAMSLSAAALKLTVGDAERAMALVGGTLDVASLGGSTNFEGALGQLIQTQSQVRSTNLSEFARNIGPGLAAATADLSQQEGVSTERALEVASVISQIIKDQTGANTATTMRMLFTRMGSFAPEREKKMDDGGIAKVTKEQIAAFKQLRTFDERLKMMAAVPAIGEQFLETQRESIGKTAISEIIKRSDRAVAFEDKAKANITSIDEAQGSFKELTKAIDENTPTLAAERKSTAALQQVQVTGGRGAEGEVEEIVQRALSNVDLSGLDYDTGMQLRNQFRLNKLTGSDAADAGIDVLERAQEQRKLFGFIPAGGGMSAEDKAFIQQQIEILKGLKASTDRTNEILENRQQQQPQRPPQAPAVRPRVAPLPQATAP